MKVLFVYHEYYKRHKKFAKIVSELGHDVVEKELKNKSIANQICKRDVDNGYDLVWLLSPHYIANGVIDDESLAFLRKSGIPTAIYSTFRTRIPYGEMMDVWEKIDYSFVMNKELASFLKSQGLEGHYVPMGFHPDQYYPVDMPIQHDISFMGSAQSSVGKENDKRVLYLNRLLDHFNLTVFGGRFKKKNVESILYSTHREQREVYSSSKINLDLPFINSPHDFYKNKLHIKNRFFEITASKGFLLTARHPDFEEIFDDSMVGYYEGIDSLIDITKMFLANEDLRNKMATSAYNEVQKHTYKHRFETMLGIIKESKK